MAEKQKPAFDVFGVEEREGQKAFFRQLGAVWPTKSGEGYNLVVHAFPLNGRLLILPHKPPKDTSEDPQA